MTKSKTWTIIGSILGLIILAVLFSKLTSLSGEPTEPKNLDDFAKCLTENGATFYGAEWCGHCQTQKKSFGDSLQHVNFVECTTHKSECSEAGVQAYPTWKFADGSKEMGFMEHEKLAEKTGCEL